ncbi:TonB-dependent receptor [Sphingomonas sp.]|uniref:TonB-dependent receptor n=1 Tax=Sphingomonas sp. TaxID=28214 RepID=UPI002EDA3963
MKKLELLCGCALALVIATPLAAQTADTTSAQDTAPTNGPGQEATTGQGTTTPAPTTYGTDIVVTAQRQSQRLQDVPIAVSAFTAENLEKQQIVNPVALQQTLPNVTFTKTNFTSSSFTIRGIGDLCVGVTCDSATAIHVNDMPLLTTRLFETEFFDLERIEVLRGPQGTLFGRNATSGVVNFITAKPDLSGIHAAGEFEYGNYDSKRVRGMFNLPITDTFGIRLAGTYLKRDGYTKNLFDDSRIDDRDLYAVRGTVSYEPTSDTRLDLMAYYFRENDNRSRIQKQLCNRDATGVLGCSPDRLEYEHTNGNSTLAAVQSSNEFLGIALGALGPVFRNFGLQSVYGADTYAGVVNPTDNRTVRVDFKPTYFAEEEQYMGKFFHDFGQVSLNLTGGYTRNVVQSRSDYNLAVENTYINNPGLVALNTVAGLTAAQAAATFGPVGPAIPGPLTAVRNTLIPNGPAGGICQSSNDPNNVGVFGGNTVGCFGTSLDFDESSETNKQYSLEGHVDSNFDGAFNFLVGGIYVDKRTYNNSYYVNAFGLDYAAGLLGAAQTIGARLAGATTYPNTFRASPFFRNNTDFYRLKSYGIFGEAYLDISDRLKFTAGVRYNNDKKFVRARTTYLQDANGLAVVVPYGSSNIDQAIGYTGLDFDANTPGNQTFAEGGVGFDRMTGRGVVDFKITPDNLVYASYSRGYKSGGINPPLSAIFAVPTTFAPEKVDSFEIGSKNTFGNGTLRLNLTGFYYKYQGLQLSRIVARTSVNDNVNADIYGVEIESVISPVAALVVNMNASYLKTKVSADKFIANPRDPSGGRSDTVIIKDITNASNCAVVPTVAGNAAGANAFVRTINAAVGLRAPTPVAGTNTTGAFGICSALQAQAAAVGAAFGGISVLGSGVEVNIRGNSLPQAPTYKASVGAQYTVDVGASGWSIVPRADLNYTGGFSASIFNNTIDRVQGYEIVNAQIQFNAPGERFYARAFVSNLTNNAAITGQYVTDQSSGLFTNIFTVEPRRYGVMAGFKF